MNDKNEESIDFGYQKVARSQKKSLVADVFQSVAAKYDVMNDLMGAQSPLKPETKTVGIGSQILKELGLQKIKLLGTPVKYPSLSGFDLEVIGFEQ